MFPEEERERKNWLRRPYLSYLVLDLGVEDGSHKLVWAFYPLQIPGRVYERYDVGICWDTISTLPDSVSQDVLTLGHDELIYIEELRYM